jgi:PadR family transcriptional regulator PadR
MRIERELMRGAGPVAVLRLLESGEKYGYELIKLLDHRSQGVLAMGLISARTEQAENGRPRKYYSLTDRGRKRLARDRKQWEALSVAMEKLGLVKLAEG